MAYQYSTDNIRISLGSLGKVAELNNTEINWMSFPH